jgi:hypothetical protein
MSLEKIELVDLIETTENGCIQVRTCTRIMDNGKEISSSFHRHVISPGDDYSKEDMRVQAICSVIHTPDIISAYIDQQEKV